MFCWVLTAVLLTLTHGAVPVFKYDALQVAVGVDVVKGREIYRFTVTDADTADIVSCTGTFSRQGGAINGDEFTFNKDTNPNKVGEFHIDVTAAPPRTTTPLETDTYECLIECRDTTNNVRSITVQIDSKANQKLDWGAALPDTLTPVDVTNLNLYGALKTIGTKTAQNDLNLDMSYFLDSVTPDLSGINGNPFFAVSESTGAITTLQDLRLIPKDTTPDGTLDLGITSMSSDGIKNTEIYTIELINQNSRPYILDLPKTIYVPELTSSTTSLFQFNISDPDVTSLLQTLNYNVSMDCQPSPEGNLIFTIDSGSRFVSDLVGNPKGRFPHVAAHLISATRNFHIQTGKAVNYEKTQLYNCSIIPNDGLHDSLTEYLEIYIQNENDACVFDQSIPYTAIMTEGGIGGGAANPGFNVTDEDGNTLSYSFTSDNDSSRFAIDDTGTTITFNEPYELDGSSPYPSEVYLTVVARDDGDGIAGNAKSCSAQVKITIVDANDNYPSCNGGVTSTMEAYNTMSGGTIIGSLSPTDADVSADNNVVTCSQNSATGTASSFFTVYSNGDVALQKEIFSGGTAQLEPGASAQYTVICSDNGSPTRATTCTVDVVYKYVDTTTASTATTTTTEKSFFDFPAGIALAVLLGLLSLGLLALGLYFCLRYCCCQGSTYCDCAGRCCERRPPPRRITPETPPKRMRTPVMVRKEARVVQQPQMQLVRTIATRPYGMQTLGTMPMRTAAFPQPTYGMPPAYFP